MNEKFLVYISLGIKGRLPIYKTRLKVRTGSLLRLMAYEEEIRQNGERIPSTGSTALKVKINHKRRPKKRS